VVAGRHSARLDSKSTENVNVDSSQSEFLESKVLKRKRLDKDFRHFVKKVNG
jgi:hypothetical protein